MSTSMIETRTARFQLDESGILIITSLGQSQETLADAQENVDAVLKIRNEKKLPILADIRKARFTDAKWRKFYSGVEHKELASAVAMLTDSALSRVIGNFFVGLNRLPMPIKVFTSETEALKWLGSFLDK